MNSVLVLGDQLSRTSSALSGATPDTTRILFVESDAAIRSRRWHVQRLHLVLTAMRRFARELERSGFQVDYRKAPSLGSAIAAHRSQFRPTSISAMEPGSFDGAQRLRALGLRLVRSNQFLCHYDEFARWVRTQSSVRLESFYRWQRRRLSVLMDGEEPAGGRWNFDAENRERPPRDGRTWPDPPRTRLDDLDREVLGELPAGLPGDPPSGLWATSRRGALARLRHFVAEILPRFGPHQDAMLRGSWHLAHALLSPYLNLGLLSPEEVVSAAEEAWRRGDAPIASVEGFVRQILGWREYMWGVYWRYMPDYARENALAANRPLPPIFESEGATEMECVARTLSSVERHGYAHHIQRLMVLGNLALLSGIEPAALTDWMRARFVDGADWVMIPNVVSMALYADGGRVTTKPYAAGGAYIDRMSDYCGPCRFRPNVRAGDDACPFTTLYWDFLARNRERLERNHRLAPQLRMLDRLSDLPAVRARAEQTLRALDRGAL